MTWPDICQVRSVLYRRENCWMNLHEYLSLCISHITFHISCHLVDAALMQYLRLYHRLDSKLSVSYSSLQRQSRYHCNLASEFFDGTMHSCKEIPLNFARNCRWDTQNIAGRFPLKLDFLDYLLFIFFQLAIGQTSRLLPNLLITEGCNGEFLRKISVSQEGKDSRLKSYLSFPMTANKKILYLKWTQYWTHS